MWFESIEICDATGLMKMTEGELCRVDGFSSHWSAPDFQSAKYRFVIIASQKGRSLNTCSIAGWLRRQPAVAHRAARSSTILQ